MRLLGLDAGAPIIPLGVVLYSHLKLRLRLRAAGFAVTFHDYDWRLGIEESGAAFAAWLREQGSRRLAIVAHSMGGLLSRTALAMPGTQHVERVVLLGTPNQGSFAPVQVLRGTYAVVRKIARLDAATTAERLTEEVFSGFPSLYQMIPVAGRKGTADLLDPRAHGRTPGPRYGDRCSSARAASVKRCRPSTSVSSQSPASGKRR